MKLMNKWRFRFCILFIFAWVFFLLNACQKNPSKFVVGEDFIESQSGFNLTDTMTVTLSTVIFDTVVTSGSGGMLIGSYRDDVFGNITSETFFQIGLPDDTAPDADDTYDSLRLVITYNGYYCGDTLTTQHLVVYQLSENIDLNDDDEISSETTFDYRPDPVGSIFYAPNPNGESGCLSIPIDDAIGRDLFEKMRDNADEIQSDEHFINYFHGLMIAADPVENGAIMGFEASASDVELILYTTYTGTTSETVAYAFGLSDTDYQFNHITHDFSSTPFNSLTEQKNALPSKETDGLSYLHGGLGMGIRVDLPFLKEILLLERNQIVKAELSISSPSFGHEGVEIPSTVILYEVDKQNQPSAYITSSSLTVDDLYHENTVYTFDVSDYLTDEFSDSYVDPEKGMLIIYPYTSDGMFASFAASANSSHTKLKIYYLSY